MKIKNILSVLLCGLFILSFSILCFLGNTPEFSDSERRVLSSFPEINAEKINSGEFAKDFETYSTDRFPFRDSWRNIKANIRLGLLGQKDNNNIFISDGHISKLDYPINYEMLDHAIKVFSGVKETYLKDNKIYVSVIPDKNRYISELKIDYNALETYVSDGMPYATNIEIGNLLNSEDYYFTDTHWKQEEIVDVAQKLAQSMGVSIPEEYTTNTVTEPFYGVYAGQSALNCKPDSISYLTNSTINNLTVKGAKAIYDTSKIESKDPYEFFLSGNQPIVQINNTENQSGKKLIIFRDSFGSSVAPLLAQGYSQVTLIDLRYINSAMLQNYVNFENADILFLYSTILLNNSLAIK